MVKEIGNEKHYFVGEVIVCKKYNLQFFSGSARRSRSINLGLEGEFSDCRFLPPYPGEDTFSFIVRP